VKKDSQERREDALRPSPFLGYNRDNLGLYLLSRQAYPIAESQFRRAIWLNPYEPRFRVHLAWTLLRMGRRSEALLALERVDDNALDPDTRDLARWVRLPPDSKEDA